MNVFPSSIPDLDILLDTPEWFEWLKAQTQFKYIGNLTEMSVKRRPNRMWYARKKILSASGSKPIDLYIGSDEECTSEKLKEINYHFGKDNSEFWRWYYDPDRKGDKGKGVQPKQMYTSTDSSSQTREEIALELIEKYLKSAGIHPDKLVDKPSPRYDQLAKFKNWLQNHS